MKLPVQLRLQIRTSRHLQVETETFDKDWKGVLMRTQEHPEQKTCAKTLDASRLMIEECRPDCPLKLFCDDS